MNVIEAEYNEDIIDILSGIVLKDTPEERVCQRFISILQSDYRFQKGIIAREFPYSRVLKFSILGMMPK